MTSDLRAIKVVWQRELLRFVKDRPRLIAGLVQPILYLFVMGTGISSMVPLANGVPFRTFLFPGVMCMAVLFTCFFSAGSLVWDRELGFMREMMVAPVRRRAILLGKCLGGMTTGTIQGLIMIVIGAIAGVPLTLTSLVTLFFELLVISFALTSFGVALATRIRSIQAFMAIMQMVLFPMFFASGALYPLTGLPTWMLVLTRIDPLTYAIAPLRAAVVEASGEIATGVSWGGFTVPIWLDLGIIGASAIIAIVASLPKFSQTDA